MARLVTKFKYLKPSARKGAGGYAKYIATREGVEKIDDTQKLAPATERQKKAIEKILRDFPQSVDMIEYDDYIQKPNMGNASEFISRAIEDNTDEMMSSKTYADYIATRPRAERFGSHGLFTDDGVQVQLSKVSEELNLHEGNVWTAIVSLRREDAERLGFNTGSRWRDMLRTQTQEFSNQFHIPMNELKWFAAFHNEGHHPHVHLMVYSEKPKQGFLSPKGVEQLRSALAKEIFAQDLLSVYEKQTSYRDALRRQSRDTIVEIVSKIHDGVYDNPVLEDKLSSLADALSRTSGKKVYGYLKADVKDMVDSIVEELATDSRIAALYDLWYQQREEIIRTYTDEIPKRVPLSQNTEFKSVRNAVVKEALNLSIGNDILENMAAHPHAIDLDKYNIAGSIKSRICVKGSCTGCNLKRECTYRKFCNNVDHASGLDFQVTNHNMYLMSQKTRNDEHPPLLRSSAFIVIDEAHKFKEAAEDTFGERISEKDIENYVTAVALLCSPVFNKDKYKEHLVEAVKENKALFASFRIKRNPNDVDEGRGSIISLTTFQSGKLAKLIHIIERIENMKVKQNHGISVTGKLLITAMTAINKTGKNTIWLDTDENGVLSLCSTPKNIDSILYNTVWNRNTSHVLTSGTMSDGTDFEYFKEENGLKQIPRRLVLESRTESPFDYANHTRLFIPKGMPMPDNASEEYFKAIADQVFEIIKATHGHTAILFTSYKTLHLVHELLKDKLGEYDIICMTRSNKTAIADFKKTKNGILFASGSMWEGVDCVGDCLSSVIIVKLPFPMRSALMEEKKVTCRNMTEFVDKHCTPNMLIKLRQGVGRLIRCETDTGLISILDPRAKSKAYCSKVFAAIDKYPLIESTKEIEDFFKLVKNAKYFE